MSFKPRTIPGYAQRVADDLQRMTPEWYRWAERLPRHDIDGSHEIPAVNVGITSVSADYSAAAERVILVDATGGPITVTLPALLGMDGRLYSVKKTDASANAVTVDGNSSDTIDGAATSSLASQYDSITVVAGPTEWNIL